MLPGQPARSGRRAEDDLSCCMKLQGAPALERTPPRVSPGVSLPSGDADHLPWEPLGS